MREANKIICNQCERELKIEQGYLKEGSFSVDYAFGYFSSKDGIRHKFDLCEECYDKIVSRFRIPVEVTTNHELL